MKNLLKFAAFVLLSLSFTACDEVDELTEIDFNTTLNESINVSVPAGEALVLNETTLINISNNDTQDYIDALQDVSITSFTYRLVDFTGDPEGTVTGQFQADGITLVNHDMVVKDEVDAGTVFEVTDPALLNTVANKLKSGNNVSVGISGTSTCAEAMNFTIVMTIELAVTADVL
jgi:hypothetical protein